MSNLRSNLAFYTATLTCLVLFQLCGAEARAAIQQVVSDSGGGAAAAAAPEQIGARGDVRIIGKGVAAPSAGVPAKSDYHKVGQGHYEAKRYREAIDAFVQALRARPQDAKLHYDLGLAYYDSKRFKEAAASLERAVRLRPDWDEAHYRLGVVYYVLSKRVSALEHYRALQKLNPELTVVLARILKLESAPTSATEAPKTDGVDRKQSPRPPDAGANNGETVVVRMRPAPVLGEAPVVPDATPKTNGDGPKAAAPPAASAAAGTGAGAARGAASPAETYRIGVGDVLDIRLPDSKTKASSLYTVMAGGVLEYPPAGVPVVAAGMTTDELAARLAAEMKRRAVSTDSRLSVIVRDYVSHKLTVKGLVRNPGARALRREAVPLYVVLAEAQLDPSAGRATILRDGQSTELDLADQAALDTLVRPSDTIEVLAPAPKFYFIGGKIQLPGQKVFKPGVTLMQAILSAGGVMRPGTNNVVELSRESAAGRLTTTRFALKEIKSGKVPDPRLESGDLIEVVQ